MRRPKISRRAETRPYGRVSAPTGNCRKFLTQLSVARTCGAGLPSHGRETTPVRFGALRGTHVGPGATSDRESRTYRPGFQSALRGHQLAGDRRLSDSYCRPLQPSVLRTRGHGEPPQGSAVGSLCRSDVLSPFLAQPVPAVVIGFGLYLDRGVASLGTGMHGTRHGAAGPNRIRLTLLRVRGGGAGGNTRRIQILLSSTCPHQELFHTVAALAWTPPDHRRVLPRHVDK